MKFVTKSVLAAVLLSLMVPAGARAQESRLAFSFTPAVATISGDAELAVAGTIGYRFTEHLSFEGDVTWIDAAADGFRNRVFELDRRSLGNLPINNILQNVGTLFGDRNRLPGGIVGGLTRVGTIPITFPDIGVFSAETEGQTWIGTMGLRYEPMVQTARFRPYVSAGLGMNFTDQRLSILAASTTRLVDESVSDAGLAFSAGGGTNIRVTDVLWLAADAKYFRLSRDRDLMRIGGGVAFKF
jgi:opacity protein-like surface antigen